MEIEFIDTPKGKVAHFIEKNVILNTIQDAVDLMMNCIYQDADKLILYSFHFNPAFFDLKTGFAGDVLQKFSTYRAKLAVVGDFSAIKSDSLHRFIEESNRIGHICFVGSLAMAIQKLSENS